MFGRQQERERAPPAFGHQHRQRHDGADPAVILERRLQRPHLLVGFLVVQRAAVGGRDDQRQRIAAAVAIDIFQSVPELLVRLEIIEEARIGVQSEHSDSERDARCDDGNRERYEAARPEWPSGSRFGHHGFARHGPTQERGIHGVRAAERDGRSQDAAESQLAERFGLHEEQASKSETGADHRPERRRKRHPARIGGKIARAPAGSVRERLPVERHVDEVRQRDHEHNRSEVHGQDADFSGKQRLHEQRDQHSARTRREHADAQPHRPKHPRHRHAEEHDRYQAEVDEIVQDAASNHLDDVGRARDPDPEVRTIEVVNDRFHAPNERLGVV